jgi:glycosyltransferase involved in cell wall biosynthesis
MQSLISSIEKHNLYQHVEILIVDNSSDDDTQGCIEELLILKRHINIKYRRNERNIGVIANIMKIVAEASAEFLMICGDDDMIQPKSLPLLMAVLHANPDIQTFLFRAAGAPLYAYEEEVVSFDIARDKFFYQIGNLGLFVNRTDAMQEALKKHELTIRSTCWPQTEMLFHTMANANKERCLYVSNIALCSYPNHKSNTVYTGYYIFETTFYALYRVAMHIENTIGEPFVRSAMANTHFFSSASRASMIREIYLHVTYRDDEAEIRELYLAIQKSIQEITQPDIVAVPILLRDIIEKPRLRRRLATAWEGLRKSRHRHWESAKHGLKALIYWLRDAPSPMGIWRYLQNEKMTENAFLQDKAKKLELKKSRYTSKDYDQILNT